MWRMDVAWTEHIHILKSYLQERIFCFAFDSRPHNACAFGVICASSRNIQKCDSRIESQEERGYGDGKLVGDPGIELFWFMETGRTETVETCVVSPELFLNGGEIKKILMKQNFQFGVLEI
jgi:hypothetical protein